MPKIDLSITISVIVALAAIISPILVAFINNIHHTKIRRLELAHELSTKQLTIFYEDKKNAFSNFLLNAGKICTDEQKHDDEQNFYAYAQQASLYASPENRKLILDFTSEAIQYLDVALPTEKHPQFLQTLSNLSESLNQELSILYLEICNNKNRK